MKKLFVIFLLALLLLAFVSCGNSSAPPLSSSSSSTGSSAAGSSTDDGEKEFITIHFMANDRADPYKRTVEDARPYIIPIGQTCSIQADGRGRPSLRGGGSKPPPYTKEPLISLPLCRGSPKRSLVVLGVLV